MTEVTNTSQVLQLGKLPAEIVLLRWNKELPAASVQDPLGLNLRVSARLAAELLHCITSITPRARYFSFFPWAIQDYANSEEGKPGDRGRRIGVLVRERAMVLGAVLHHNGHACEGGALGGSDRASVLATSDAESAYDLSTWEHLARAPAGQFGAAYQASIINLGIFETANVKVEEEADPATNMLSVDLEEVDLSKLSSRGKKLANAFRNSIASTRYGSENWSTNSTVDRKVLQDFGSKAGLCEISQEGAEDREILREIFFSCDRDTVESAHYRRRMSLLLLLQCIRASEEADVAFDEDTFSDLTYFRAVIDHTEDSTVTTVELPSALHDIAERWRVFHFHSYFSLALQSILVAVVRALRDHDGGIDRSRLFDEFDGRVVASRLSNFLHHEFEKDFFAYTPAETLESVGWDMAKIFTENLKPQELPTLGEGITEREITASLIADDEVNQLGGLGLAAFLLYIILARYRNSITARYDAWYRNHVIDPASDISLAGLSDWLEGGDPHWWTKSNGEILNDVVWKYIVLQHQRMSYERGFGGSAPLFHLDGTTIISTGVDYIDPALANARLPSAIQVLIDLGLLGRSDDRLLSLTPLGLDWLKVQLEREENK